MKRGTDQKEKGAQGKKNEKRAQLQKKRDTKQKDQKYLKSKRGTM